MLTISAIATLIFAAAAVVAQLPPIPVGELINIKDFQGNVFDLADRSTQNFAPVQTLNRKPGEGAQGWTIQKSPTGNGFIIQNPFTTISNTGVLAGLDHKGVQICGNGGGAPPTVWNIIPNASGAGYNILEASSNLSVTSWQALTSPIVTPSAPLTLQLFDPKVPQQIFNFPLCEPVFITCEFLCPQNNQQLLFNAATRAVF
ncbi:hypothetical protein DFH08DRAFT_934472 [Mycena albidolilacea]|uniref:Ricin B lectin domain-containing protein n=1 Tax=Mycena albidolilacea TaxID=1033008 RepID=A0AAD7AC07_9AGAR|nr:hypothetical protein DFH08DRAFT_934472 [Mycena albidolilacea]